MELPLSKDQFVNMKVKINMKEKKLGGRPKLASYQKRTKCFRVMFTENDYIYIQSKAEQAGLSVNEFAIRQQWIVWSVSVSVRKWYRQSVTFPVSLITSIRLHIRCTSMDWKQSNNSVFRLSRKLVELSPK